MNINNELANILLSTRLFNESTLQIGNGEADVIIEDKMGYKWYFEIKQSSWPHGKFFDAATLTQWNAWYQNKERYYFVFITGKYKKDRKFTFINAYELMEHSTIPPFKIYFNLYKDQVIDNFIDKKKFLQQVHELVANNNHKIIPSMKQHKFVKAPRISNNKEGAAVQFKNVPIDELQNIFDSLKE